MILLFVVFIILNICHWAGDYTHLSMPFILQAKKLGKPIGPIAVHAYIHAIMFFAVSVFFYSKVNPFLIGYVQFISHFCIDILKGRLNGWFPKLQNQNNYFHWYVFGGDQFLHQMVIAFSSYLIVYGFSA